MNTRRQSKRVAAKNLGEASPEDSSVPTSKASQSSARNKASGHFKLSLSKEQNDVKKEHDQPSEDEWMELPHGLGKQRVQKDTKSDPKGAKLPTSPIEKSSDKKEDSSEPKGKRPKAPYGLTPGSSPYPDYLRPSATECEEVHKLLTTMHGARSRPKKIPRASATVSGCGEVPFVLDAVLRTLLSANTSGRNAAVALQGLISAFGSIDNSPNWDVVRQASLPAVVESIKRGGLANVKATNIKAILDAVYNRNIQEAGEVPKTEIDSKSQDMNTTITPGPESNIVGQNPLLRIDYISKMSDEDAMTELTTLPGIGVKTAACVLLFNMGRDVFAVDTHVYRLCQWLGWLPDVKGMTRDKAFSHLEVRIPGHLKYSLHTQLVVHGRECLRCRANTSPNTPGWSEAICPIEKLVTRTGAMKSGQRGGKNLNGKSAAKDSVAKKEKNLTVRSRGKRKRGSSDGSEDETDEE